ncbi:MAG: hypothetical protein ACTHV8_05615 [Nesterenkonia sp.]
MEYQVLHDPDCHGRRILIHTSVPGSATADLLRLLTWQDALVVALDMSPPSAPCS